MASNPPIASLQLFKETRVDIEPPLRSVIQIQVPSSSTFSVRPRQHHRILRTNTAFATQEAFGNRYFASSASILHGSSTKYPRSFLWRVVNDQKVLELRSVDLSKSEEEPREASHTLQLCFNGQLKHGGVALAETDDANILNVFALTRANELYTFAIRKDFFCYAAASEEDPSRWCKLARPATFSISAPHRLVAASPVQLIVSLADGRLLQLTRKKADNGSRWDEAVYGDGQWSSSLRGLVRWQGSNTVRYDGMTLEQATPIAMAQSPDQRHTFAVCMNHTLRIWTSRKAGAVFSKDLLWREREQHDIPKVMMDPGNPNVLQMLTVPGSFEGDLYYAVTFSPHDFGQFKFWAIRDPDHGESGVRDLFPDDSLKAPDPDPEPESIIWKVVDFKIKTSQADQTMDIWVLMRSSRRYKVFNLKSTLHDLPERWQKQWNATAVQTTGGDDAPAVSETDPDDSSDEWLKCILKPGKYPAILLENALNTYCVGRSLTVVDPKRPLAERMRAAITSQIDPIAGKNDVQQLRIATHKHWTALWQGIGDLDKSRFEVLSLALDGLADTPWIIFVEGCSAIRSCTRLETMVHNKPEILAVSHEHLEMPSIETESGFEPRLPDELAVIIEAAADFRKTFNSRLRHKYKTALANELWLEPNLEMPIRLRTFYEQCGFSDEVGDGTFADLDKSLEPIGGVAGLDTEAFLAIMETFAHIMNLASSGLSYTRFGTKLLLNGAREMIEQRERTLLDLLALAVFVEMEVDMEQNPMEYYDGSRVYGALTELLKPYQVMQWLISNTRNNSFPTENTRGRKGDSLEVEATILESIFAIDMKPQSNNSQPEGERLSHNIQDLLQWVIGGNYNVSLDEIPVRIQCNLLANNDVDLASDFLRFQPATAWATYIKGRLYILRGETNEAALHFKKAGFKLSRPAGISYHEASEHLLSPVEATRLGQGLPTYYAHITELFMIADPPCHTEAAKFAHLALQLVPTQPPSEQATSLLNSLFTASLRIPDFTTAYSALTRHPSPSTLLPGFITTILSTPKALPKLLSFPWPPSFHTDIDTLLSAHRNPKILAAWRMHHNDFRGAAAALLPTLQATQAKAKRTTTSEELENDYLTVINLLACAGKGNAWVLSGGSADGGKAIKGNAITKKKGKRQLFTLEDLRHDYQAELDRRSVIEGGRFAFGGGDEMDVA